MPSKLDALLELEKRGELPPRETAVLKELRKRGELPSQISKQQVPPPPVNLPSTTGGFSVSDRPPTDLDRTKALTTGRRPAPTGQELGQGAKRVFEKTKEITSSFVKPTAEIGLTTKGAAAGGRVGAAFGPAGALTGSLIGAGIGFAASRRASALTDTLLGQRELEPLTSNQLKKELVQTSKDFVTGVASEAGGLAVAKTLGFGVNLVGKVYHNVKGFAKKATGVFSDSTLRTKAGDLLVANTTGGNIYARNIEEATQIEKEIPGLKFTRSQLSYDPKEIALENAIGKNAIVKQRAEGAVAIRRFIKNTFPESEGISDTIVGVELQQEAVQKAAEDAGKIVALQQDIMLKGADPQTSGQIILNSLKLARGQTKQVAKTLYDEVPNVDVPVSALIDDIEKIKKPLSRIEESQKDNFPAILDNFLNLFKKDKQGDVILFDARGDAINLPSVIEGLEKTLPFQELRGIRTVILNELRDAAGGISPNAARQLRLGTAKEAVEKAIDQLEHTPGSAADIYRKASTFYREYSRRFKTGTVADVLRPGVRGEPQRIALTQIAGRFFKAGNLDAADDFIRAAGSSPGAVKAIEDFAAHDLLTSTIDPLTKDVIPRKFAAWFSKNKSIIKRFNLTDRFSSAEKAQKQVEKVAIISADFDKSVASRLLGVDESKAVGQAFAGKAGKSVGITMGRLVKQIGGDKAGVRGLKKSYQEFLFNKAISTGVDVLDDSKISASKLAKILESHLPGIKVLYKDEPKKIKALGTVLKAYQILGRNATSPLGGGVDTAENILIAISNVTAPFVTGRLSQLNSIKNVTKYLSRQSQEQTEAFLTQAVFNPDFAETLIMMSKNKAAPKFIQKRLNHHMATIGLLHPVKRTVDDIPDPLGLDADNAE